MTPQHHTAWDRKVRSTWQQLLADQSYTVTGTLKFNNGSQIGRTTARKLLCAYWHKLDRTFFGPAANKGIGIDRWIFAEYGEDGNNLHFQFKAKAPIDPFHFCCIANLMWTKFDPQTSSSRKSWITPTLLHSNSASYTVKDTANRFCDNIGLAASHQNKTPVDVASFQNQAQCRRILNQVTLDEIIAVEATVNWHIKRTITGILNRQRNTELLGIR